MTQEAFELLFHFFVKASLVIIIIIPTISILRSVLSCNLTSKFKTLRTNPAFDDFTDEEIQFLLNTSFPEEGLYLLLKDKKAKKKQVLLKEYCVEPP
jgi:uncharacterized protein (UPF0254 family)